MYVHGIMIAAPWFVALGVLFVSVVAVALTVCLSALWERRWERKDTERRAARGDVGKWVSTNDAGVRAWSDAYRNGSSQLER